MAELTTLLPNAVVERLGRMRLQSLGRNTTRAPGGHLGRKGGTSTEFADYRDYSPGDDTRHLDWNIFSRTRRPYIRQYHDEEILHVLVLIDLSNSMEGEGKVRRAIELAAAIGLVALAGGERLSVVGIGGEGLGEVKRLRPCQGLASRGKLLRFLETLEGGGRGELADGVRAGLAEHRGRGVAVVLSDFLGDGELSRPFDLLYAAGLEILALQVLGPSEIEPELGGDVRLVDSETGEMIDLSALPELLAIYREEREALEEGLARAARQRGGRKLRLSSGDELEEVLFGQLVRGGWLR